MKEEILIAGYGGQGVILAGSLIANTAISDGLETCGMVSYGAEMRGGTANSTVIVSDERIGSPVVITPTSAIIMNDQSLDKFEKIVQKGGLIFLNTSEVRKKVTRSDVTVIALEATKIAEEMGNKKIANLIMIGSYLKHKNIVSLDSALENIKVVLPKANQQMIELNKKALLKGYGL